MMAGTVQDYLMHSFVQVEAFPRYRRRLYEAIYPAASPLPKSLYCRCRRRAAIAFRKRRCRQHYWSMSAFSPYFRRWPRWHETDSLLGWDSFLKACRPTRCRYPRPGGRTGRCDGGPPSAGSPVRPAPADPRVYQAPS